MDSSVVFKLACFVFACVVVSSAPKADAEIQCGQVVRYLTPCISYVSNGGTVPAECCSGIKSLYSLAQTTADRQSVCKCLSKLWVGFHTLLSILVLQLDFLTNVELTFLTRSAPLLIAASMALYISLSPSLCVFVLCTFIYLWF